MNMNVMQSMSTVNIGTRRMRIVSKDSEVLFNGTLDELCRMEGYRELLKREVHSVNDSKIDEVTFRLQ